MSHTYPSPKKERSCPRKYDQDYFSELACSLGDISEEDADCMIRTIEKVLSDYVREEKRI